MIMMFADFHVCGMLLLFSAMLYMLVWYVSPSGPICLRYTVLNLPDTVELLFLLCFPRDEVVVCRMCVFLYICLFYCMFCV